MPTCTDPARREVGGIALGGAQASQDPAAPGAAAAVKHCVGGDESRVLRCYVHMLSQWRLSLDAEPMWEWDHQIRMSTRRLAMATHDTSRASAFGPASHALAESPAGHGIGQACCQVTWCPNCSGPAVVSAIRCEPACSLRVVIAALESSCAADSSATACRRCCTAHLGSLEQAAPRNSRRSSGRCSADGSRHHHAC